MKILVLDFETTGLDTLCDEPIQIALATYDLKQNTGTLRSHYVKPRKKTSLNDIITHITGLHRNDLADKPTLDDLLPTIQGYTHDIQWCIGHNISFDIAIYHNHIDSKRNVKTVDTRELSQIFLPYRASYSLDQLVLSLRKDGLYQQIQSHLLHVYNRETWGNAHDACTDVLDSLALFLWCREQTKLLIKNYGSYLEPLFAKMVDIPPLLDTSYEKINNNTTKNIPIILFPALTSPSVEKKKKKKQNEGFSLPSHECLRVGNRLELLNTLTQANHPFIIACSHTQKLNILKRDIFKQTGEIPGFLNHNQRLSTKKWHTLLERETLDRGIISFCLKYFVHLRQGYKIFDTSRKIDKRIISYLQDEDNNQHKQKQLTLCTHQSAYETRTGSAKSFLHPNTTVIFLDADWRYYTYNKRKTTTIDPYNIIDEREYCLFLGECEEKSKIERLRIYCIRRVIWAGIISIEANKICQDNKTQEYVILNFSKESGFFWTEKILENLADERHNKRSTLPLLARQKGDACRHLLLSLSTQTTICHKDVKKNGHPHFVFRHEQKFCDFTEFRGLWGTTPIFFISQYKNTHQRGTLSPLSYPPPKRNDDEKEVKKILASESCIFVLSIDKNTSARIRQRRFTLCKKEGWRIEAENTSGGHKKLVSIAQNEKKRFLIGGYKLALSLFAEGIKPKVFVAHVTGPLAETVCHDLAFYFPS